MDLSGKEMVVDGIVVPGSMVVRSGIGTWISRNTQFFFNVLQAHWIYLCLEPQAKSRISLFFADLEVS